MTYQVTAIILTSLSLSFIGVPEAPAQYFGGVTVLGVNKEYNSGLVERVQILWDGKSEPEKIHVIWSAPGIRPFGVFGGVIGGVKLGASARESLVEAFRYAVEQTPAVQHSGTVTLQGTSYLWTTNEGPSAGAAMAVAFMAMFNRVRLRGDICLTGALEPGGRIGKVGSIPQKMQAAKTGGCLTVLVPANQIFDSAWNRNLQELALDYKIKVQEVDTIDEAYRIMTTPRL